LWGKNYEDLHQSILQVLVKSSEGLIQRSILDAVIPCCSLNVR